MLPNANPSENKKEKKAPTENLTLLSDSYLRNGSIALTSDVTVPSSSCGTVIYNDPIPFFDP